MAINRRRKHDGHPCDAIGEKAGNKQVPAWGLCVVASDMCSRSVLSLCPVTTAAAAATSERDCAMHVFEALCAPKHAQCELRRTNTEHEKMALRQCVRGSESVPMTPEPAPP